MKHKRDNVGGVRFTVLLSLVVLHVAVLGGPLDADLLRRTQFLFGRSVQHWRGTWSSRASKDKDSELQAAESDT